MSNGKVMFVPSRSERVKFDNLYGQNAQCLVLINKFVLQPHGTP